MATIFTSYRRADADSAWARQLVGQLEEEFDVFFDVETLEPGDIWPAKIKEALLDCRVMLIVIGSGWMEEQNLLRLQDAKDWVRKEILTALSREPPIRIIPIIVGRGSLPTPEQLPAELRALPFHHAHRLSHDTWNANVGELISKLRKGLTGRAPPQGRNSSPGILPYLCDRLEQEDELEDRIKLEGGRRRIFDFILHGHKFEGHDGFLERLQHSKALEDLYNARTTGITVHALEWNAEHARRGQYRELLQRAIKKQVMEDRSASDEALREFLKASSKPLVLVLQVTWVDYQECGEALLSGLIEAWYGLFAGIDEHGGIVPNQPMTLWLNVSYDELDQRVNTSHLRGVLSVLEPVSRRHIEEWLRKPEVKRHMTRHESRLRRIADDPRYRVSEGRVHMLRFAEAVQEILASP